MSSDGTCVITSGSGQEIKEESLSPCLSSSPPSADLSSAGEEQKSASISSNPYDSFEKKIIKFAEEEKNEKIVQSCCY